MALSTIDTSSISGLGYGFKNRIINGAMGIDQRNAGASVTPTVTGSYKYNSVDRIANLISQASKFSMQQSSTAPTGFINSLLITSASAYSVGAGDYFVIAQPIEGLNVSDLAWGSASAATVTLSFWVRSSLTGAFGGALQNSAEDRSYPFTYTINAANTWEQKTLTIAGDQSGTWLTTNGIGIRVILSLGCGTTYGNGTAGAWAAGQKFQPTGSTSVVGTSGATFYITGVQLEKGTVATSFDYRPYGTELALCRRYALKMGNDTGNVPNIAFGPAGNTTTALLFYYPQVAFRSTPSLESYSGLGIDDTNGTISISSLVIDASSSPNFIRLHATATGLTQFRTYFLRGTTSAGNLVLSAEL